MMKINYRTTFNYNYRSFSSALYITGEKAQNNFAVLTPIIDFEKHIKNKENLVKNIRARGLEINVDDILKRWAFFQDILKRKQNLELTKAKIGQKTATLLKLSNADPLEIEKLKLLSKTVKDDLKNLKTSFYDIEETTMIKVLGLPNILHSRTPLDREYICYSHLNKPQNDSVSHMDIGEEMKYIKYLDPFTCYFKSDAALFEIKILNLFREALIKLNYLNFSNPNFCRSIISEGCNEICQSDENMFRIEEQNDDFSINKLHLCGSASLYSFMAYFSRHLVFQNAFPLKYFSLGKLYKPVKNQSLRSLFNLNQQTIVNIFIADLEDKAENLNNLVELITNIYNSLGVHYRLAILPANKIDNAESLRISIQMYSNFEKNYIEVGNVSFYNSYISKRLIFTYFSNKEKRYPNVISGSLLNVHKFLGCFLENTDKSLLTEYLKLSK